MSIGAGRQIVDKTVESMSLDAQQMLHSQTGVYSRSTQHSVMKHI